MFCLFEVLDIFNLFLKFLIFLSIFLLQAAERGSKEARDTVTEMLKKGLGLNESNFEAVYACSWSGGLTVSQLMGRRLGRKAFRQLDLGL